MIHDKSFSVRLMLWLGALLIAFAGLVGLIGKHLAAEYELESLQRLSRGLAAHLVEHWPQVAATASDQASLGLADRAAREKVLEMLMAVNPGVQAYVLDSDGRVDAYLGEAGMVREQQVDLQVVREFLAGSALPLRGTDPMGSGIGRVFSAAMFAPRPGETRPPGYLYIVLDGAARVQVSDQLSQRRFWQSAALILILALLATVLLGGFALRRLTIPLQTLANRMIAYSRFSSAEGDANVTENADSSRSWKSIRASSNMSSGPARDEVQVIAEAFEEMTQRIESQAVREHQQTLAHREMMASVAHDLRTPLTALHGHLEALGRIAFSDSRRRDRLVLTALAQSNKVRRLSQQLFEMAALQSTNEVLHRERFRLDELVADAVQKYDVSTTLAPVSLAGAPPGRLELEGDLQLIERALTNLIDNAMRHAPGTAPVKVSLRCEDGQALILVEDDGPGLPVELLQRLAEGRSLRDPPLKRLSGGIGGLGLAIAQRVAILHGGSLRPLSAPDGGTRLCLTFPLAV
jgi:signal transduction histidine kinase